jgi:polysaccharide deacetylase 2 family uncharacterized protein YibQ
LGGERMKRLVVISLGFRHIVFAAAALAVLAAAVIFWPRQAHGGEGGYEATVYGEEADASEPGPGERKKPARLAIIIDDFGHGREGVQQMMSIDRPLTFAVMPFGPYTRQDADNGHARGYEIIVHLPMEPLRGQREWLGSNPILCSQDSDKIASIARMALADVPHAVGANVHMGSKASADERVMRSILQEVRASGLFFVDSKTSEKSVIKGLAREMGVPCLERNVFLDGHRPESYIVKQLRLAADIALKQGYAIAIGHVGAEGGKPTAAAISSMLDEFDEKGVQLVFVSELFEEDRPKPVGN